MTLIICSRVINKKKCFYDITIYVKIKKYYYMHACFTHTVVNGVNTVMHVLHIPL